MTAQSLDWNLFWAREWPALVVWPLLLSAAYVFFRRKQAAILDPWLVLLAFNLRLYAGVFLLLVHLVVLKACDSCIYYESAQFLAHQIAQNPSSGWQLWFWGWYSDSGLAATENLWVEVPNHRVPLTIETSYWFDSQAFTLVRILTLLWWPAGGSMVALTLYCSAAGFVGIWLFFREFIPLYPRHRSMAYALLFLLPGVVLWSSGLLKDSWAFGSQCALVGLLLRALRLRSWRAALWLLPPLLILGSIRPYLLAALLPVLTLIVLVRWAGPPRALPVLGIATVWVAALLYVFQDQVIVLLELSEYHRWYALNFGDAPARGYSGNSAFDLGCPETGWREALRWLRALLSCFFRPWPWEIHRWLEVPMMLENMGLLLFSVYHLIFLDYRKAISGWKTQPLILFFIGFSLVYGTFIGMSSPYFGSLWRYRVYVVPFLLLGLALLRRKDHPLTIFSRFRWSAAANSAE